MDDNSLIHRKGKTYQTEFKSRSLLCSRSGQRYFNRKIEILTDTETRQCFWQDYMLHYFPQGVNDPDYCILCFHTEEAVLWIDRKFERIVL